MFRGNARRGDPVLPMAGMNGSGGYGSRNRGSPSISRSFMASIGWVLVSSILIVCGYVYCRARLEVTNFDCDKMGCILEKTVKGVKATSMRLARENVVRAELVRVQNGEIVNAGAMRRQAQRRLGYSYAIVYKTPDSEDDDDESYDSYEDDDDSYDSYEDSEDSSESEDDDDDDDDDDQGPRSRRGPGNSRPPPKPRQTNSAAKETVQATEAKAAQERFPGDAGTMDEVRRNNEQAALREREARYREAAERHSNMAQMHAETARIGNNLHDREPGSDRPRRPRRAEPDEPKDNIDDFHAPGHLTDSKEEAENLEREREREERENSEREREESIRRIERDERLERAQREALKKPGQGQAPGQRPDTDNESYQGGGGSDRGGANNALNQELPDTDGKDRNTAPTKTHTSDEDHRASASENKGEEGAGGRDAEIKDLEMRLAQEKRIQELQAQLQEAKAAQRQTGVNGDTPPGGGRRLSSVAGAEVMDAFDQEEGEQIKGGGRKLMAGRRTGTASASARARRNSKPSERIVEEGHKERNVHREHHGHHMHRRPKAGQKEKDEDEPKQMHHHRSFHHKKKDPNKPQGPGTHSHVHPSFHHNPGEEKVPHGWRHQNRRWHAHETSTILGTPFSLSRTKARSRMDAINNYVYKRGKGEARDNVHLSDAKRWRPQGLWMMILGGISLAFSLVIGNFTPRPKGKKAT
ncbi:unnamed protein product [Discosporangium mesarthrocarpum]